MHKTYPTPAYHTLLMHSLHVPPMGDPLLPHDVQDYPHLPPALQHLRNIILQKYMESALQETPMDLSIRTDRDSADSTGSKSPRSEASWYMSKCSRDNEDDDDEDIEVVHKPKQKYTPKRRSPEDLKREQPIRRRQRG